MAVLRKEIGDLLVDNGVITDDELETARLERQRTGESIVGILSRQGLATESHLKNALELQYGVNYVPLIKTKTPPDPDVVSILPEEVMRLHQVVCINKQDSRVTVAMADPSDASAMDDLKNRLSGMQIKTVVSLEDEIEEFLNAFFAKDKNAKVGEIAEPKPADRPKSLLERITASQRKSAINETTEIPRPVMDAAIAQETNQNVLAKAAENFAAANTPSEAPVLNVETVENVDVEIEPSPAPAPHPVVAPAPVVEPVAVAAPTPPVPEPVAPSAPVAAATPVTPSVATSQASAPILTDAQRAAMAQHQASKSPTLMGIAAMVAPDDSETELAKRAQEEAIVLLANQILSSAIKRHCSNIHISPGEREGSVNYRLEGALYVDRKLPKAILTAIVARYKMMARMNLAERNICQDGHIKVKSSAKEIVCLVSVIPTQHGEHVSIWIV